MEKPTTQAKIKYAKYTPMLTLPFYMEYQKKILNEFKYENKITDIYGFVNYNQYYLRFEDYSFNFENINIKSGNVYYVKGLFCHFSTYEDFMNCSEINNLNEKIKSNICNTDTNNNEKYGFVILCYGDLKKHVYHYNLVHINYPVTYKITAYSKLKKESEEENFINKHINKKKLNNRDNVNFFNLMDDFENSQENYPVNISDIFFDGSAKFDNLSHFLKGRVYINLINHVNVISKDLNSENYKEKVNENMGSIKNICIYLMKENPKMFIDENQSNVSTPKLSLENNNTYILKAEILNFDEFKTIEVNQESFAKNDLTNAFNSDIICENSVDLNINLMKWRMAPELNVDRIKTTKFLLIGAGTLGCHVSRNLLGWGARHINFIDCGYISYSNPVRQSLYTFSDAKAGDSPKAETAAKALKEIFPSVHSEGFSFQIPLPGRKLIDEKAQKSYFEKIEKLENLIKENDVVFLLTDSRESRWFPTVLAKMHNKICVTAAIGFDSFVVMRHGAKLIHSDNNKFSENLKSNGNSVEKEIGCYFCNDIVSPVDTSMSRTLDQQCTISRPGISGICSGFASEMGISMIQKGCGLDDDIPEIIRGNIKDFNFLKLRLEASKNCIACSENILKTLIDDRENFLLNVMNQPDYLEDICGVSKLMQEVKLDDIEYIDDEEDF